LGGLLQGVQTVLKHFHLESSDLEAVTLGANYWQLLFIVIIIQIVCKVKLSDNLMQLVLEGGM
jgi:hypothetical protein